MESGRAKATLGRGYNKERCWLRSIKKLAESNPTFVISENKKNYFFSVHSCQNFFLCSYPPFFLPRSHFHWSQFIATIPLKSNASWHESGMQSQSLHFQSKVLPTELMQRPASSVLERNQAGLLLLLPCEWPMQFLKIQYRSKF